MTQESTKSPAEVYDSYYGPGMFTPWAKKLVDRFPPNVGHSVLDLACGTGLVTQQIAGAIGSSGSITALDISPVMLEFARTRNISGPGVEWIQGSADAIPFPDDSFDSAYCQQGFQFFPDRAKCAAEVRRVLRPSGRLAVSVWASIEQHALFGSLFRSVAHRLNVPIDAAAKPYSFSDPGDLKTLLSQVGFQSVEVTTESMDATFTSPESWVKLSVQGAAAAIPAFGELSDEERAALIPGIEDDLTEVFQAHIDGNIVRVPLTAHIAVGTV